MKRLLGFATAFAVLGTLLSIPAVMPVDTQTATLSATIGTVNDIAIESHRRLLLMTTGSGFSTPRRLRQICRQWLRTVRSMLECI